MQTMPAFVYLIPAVLFFGLGPGPGAFSPLPFLHIFYDKNIYIIVIYDKIFLTQ